MFLDFDQTNKDKEGHDNQIENTDIQNNRLITESSMSNSLVV